MTPGVVPTMPVDQFRWPYTTWPTPLWMGATSETAGHSFWIASASPRVSVGCVPAPILTPPEVVAPGRMMRRLLPMLEICSEIFWLAPVPTATMAITAPTPMMMPSMVSAERILFTRRARKDILKVEGMFIIMNTSSEYGSSGLQIERSNARICKVHLQFAAIPHIRNPTSAFSLLHRFITHNMPVQKTV